MSSGTAGHANAWNLAGRPGDASTGSTTVAATARRCRSMKLSSSRNSSSKALPASSTDNSAANAIQRRANARCRLCRRCALIRRHR
ncbi:hypothetical protein H1235_01750 [Pseudoxanthomonas sp. NC8]|nr:hypothetical protein H1235_01750 [Pseudoxanthomonas sp. NC8]